MHEFSLMADLLRKIESIAREQNASKVAKVKVKLGALAHISANHFREHFVSVTESTIAAGAELDIEELEDVNDPHAQEIILDSIDVEV